MALLILTFGVLLQRFSFPLTFCIDSTTVAKLFSIRKQLAWYYKDITYVAKGYACTWHTLRAKKKPQQFIRKMGFAAAKKSESHWQADESIPQRQYLHNLQLNIDILFYIFINLIAFIRSHSLFVCISRTDLSSMKCASSFPEFSHFINYLKYAYNICSTSTSLMDVPGENE